MTTKAMNGQCPNCRQFKIEKRWARVVLAGAWITIVGIPLSLVLIGLIFIPIGIAMMVIGRLALRGEYCVNCHWSTVRA